MRMVIPWPYFGHISIILPVCNVLFEYINNHKTHNHKQLILIGDALSVPVPGTKEILQRVQKERKCKIFFSFISQIWSFFNRFHKKMRLLTHLNDTIQSLISIQKTQHPKRQLGSVGHIPVVGEDIRVFNTCNLRKVLAAASYFKSVFCINFKVAMSLPILDIV